MFALAAARLAPYALRIAFGALALVTLAGIAAGFIMHERALGAEREKDRQHNADMAWLKDAQDIGADAQAKAAALAAQLAEAKRNRAIAKQDSDHLSAANDGRVCFDDRSAGRLRQRGAVQPSGAGVPAAAGAAGAGGVRR